MPDRCQYEFDIEAWEEEHERESELRLYEEIVEDAVWHCPPEAVPGHDECVFHLAPGERTEVVDVAELLIEAVEVGQSKQVAAD